MIFAMVVLPTPGGPQRIREGTFPDLMALCRKEEGDERCSWPISSSNRLGRMRSARGVGFIFEMLEFRGKKQEVGNKSYEIRSFLISNA